MTRLDDALDALVADAVKVGRDAEDTRKAVTLAVGGFKSHGVKLAAVEALHRALLSDPASNDGGTNG